MIRLLPGDCREVLATLPAASVQCVVTSPPYYGLRDYGTAQWDGGDAACDHARQSAVSRASSGLDGATGTQGGVIAYRDTCGKCGAKRIDRQIGLEATPDEYLATMVRVFREVRRALRDDGTCWVNMGDSYASDTRGTGGANPQVGGGKRTILEGQAYGSRKFGMGTAKPKDLLMMPVRLALALQADGWWLRSDIIWHKPNPMPESVTDRPTSAHEHVFLLTKRATYYYDADAVREANSNLDLTECVTHWKDRPGNGEWPSGTGGRMGSVQSGRNLRNVWTIATAPYAEAHFATFPPALAERCIKAGTSEKGCCGQCGAPWGRVTSVSYTDAHRGMVGNQRKTITDGMVMHAGRENDVRMDKHVATTGWAPGCACDAPVVPCTVLDPFAGAGTTLLVADRLQRHAIGIELNPAYTEMAMQRCHDDLPLFTSWPPADDQADARMADLFQQAAD